MDKEEYNKIKNEIDDLLEESSRYEYNSEKHRELRQKIDEKLQVLFKE